LFAYVNIQNTEQQKGFFRITPQISCHIVSSEPFVEPVEKVNDAFVESIFIELFAEGTPVKFDRKPLNR
jgi:hypothetical protein